MNKNFEPFREEFQKVVGDTLDYELIFDQVDCRKKLEEYVKQQLAVKPHEYELIEIKDHAVYFYQPFQNTKRRVAIESEHLTESPTLVNTKENGRLLITGGIDGYSSSNQVFQVDMCMNTLLRHSEMNVGRVGHAAVYINNKDIYVIGGYNAD